MWNKALYSQAWSIWKAIWDGLLFRMRHVTWGVLRITSFWGRLSRMEGNPSLALNNRFPNRIPIVGSCPWPQKRARWYTAASPVSAFRSQSFLTDGIVQSLKWSMSNPMRGNKTKQTGDKTAPKKPFTFALGRDWTNDGDWARGRDKSRALQNTRLEKKVWALCLTLTISLTLPISALGANMLMEYWIYWMFFKVGHQISTWQTQRKGGDKPGRGPVLVAVSKKTEGCGLRQDAVPLLCFYHLLAKGRGCNGVV